MRVGFAGLGRMGWHMASNLVAVNHEVTVWNRSQQKSAKFCRNHKAAQAATPKALAEATDLVVIMLADDAASNAVHCGDDGLHAATSGAKTFIEMGTMSPEHITMLYELHEPNLFIDAPVSGATKAASEATLMIMAGASEQTLSDAMPILTAMGNNVIALGKPGAGSIMKLAINTIIHGLNQTTSEALVMAEAAGIDANLAFDALEASAVAAPMLKYRRDIYLDEAAHDVTFTMDLAKKDMRLITALARANNVDAPQATLNLSQLEDAIEAGFGDRDMASMINYLREKTK